MYDQITGSFGPQLFMLKTGAFLTAQQGKLLQTKKTSEYMPIIWQLV